MQNDDLISKSALKKDVRDVVFAVADTPLSNDPMSKLIFKMGELFRKKIDDAPVVDAAPVRHGRYGFVGMDMMVGPSPFYYGTCGECHERIKFDPKHRNYCPNCGAKMDGDADVPKS